MYSIDLEGRRLTFETAPGVFSSDGPDPGSSLLLETVLPHVRPHQRVLDLGCGSGFLGLALAAQLTRGEVWLVDVDIRASRLSERNVERNGIANAHVVLGDGTRDLPKSLRFDLVVSNPPTHNGKDVLKQLVAESYAALRPGGSLLVVVNRLLSIKALMLETFGHVEIEARRHGFVVLRSTKQRGYAAD